jgi:hypothetical protein
MRFALGGGCALGRTSLCTGGSNSSRVIAHLLVVWCLSTIIYASRKNKPVLCFCGRIKKEWPKPPQEKRKTKNKERKARGDGCEYPNTILLLMIIPRSANKLKSHQVKKPRDLCIYTQGPATAHYTAKPLHR